MDADSTVEEACDVSQRVFKGQIGSITLIRSCRSYYRKMRLALLLEVNRATTMRQTGPHTRVYSMCVYVYVAIILYQNSDKKNTVFRCERIFNISSYEAYLFFG